MNTPLGHKEENKKSILAFKNWHALRARIITASSAHKHTDRVLFNCTVLKPDGRELIRHYSVSVLLNWQCFITKSFRAVIN